VTTVAYRSDGQWLAAGFGSTVLLLRAADRHAIELACPSRVTALAWAPDGKTLAVAFGQPGRSGSIQWYALADTGTVAPRVGPIVAHDDVIHALAFRPDGQVLASCSYDRSIKTWSASEGRLVRTLKDHSDAVYGIAWSPDGQRLASVSADRTVKIWNPATGDRLLSLNDPTDWVYAVAWSPKGNLLAAAGVDRSIRLWEVHTAEARLVRSAFAHERPVIQLAFSADAIDLFSLSEDRQVKVWDTSKLTEKRLYPVQPESVMSFAIRPDGQQLALGRYDGTMLLLDRNTGQVTDQPLPLKPKPPTIVRVNPDHVAIGGRQKVIVQGDYLAGVSDLIASAPSLRLVPGSIHVESTTKAHFTVEAPTGAEPGLITLRLKSPTGESNPVSFAVDRFPAQMEPNGTEDASSAPTILADTTIVGRLARAGEMDHFRVRLDAGQSLGVQIQPVDGGKLEPVLVWTDRRGQKRVESDRGSLGFQATEAGEYLLTVRDREYRGGTEFGYRLHLGRVPVVTSFTPIGIGRGEEVTVDVRGVYLDGPTHIRIRCPADAAVGSRIPVPVASSLGKVLQAPTLVVGEFPHVGMGTTIPLPGSGQGCISKPGQADIWSFQARKGEPIILEIEARRLGSQLDSIIDVLDKNGRPVEQAVLRCVARTFVTFRDHDSVGPGIRMEAWNEFAIDDYVLVGQELMKIQALPRNPDDDCRFYAVDGRRVGFLGTTPTHHAMNTPMYKVTIHPPGTPFPPNGMPTFTLTYRNDDGGPGYGKDSRLRFVAPSDGEYRIRVTDARGLGGPGFGYRLTIRPPRPDFRIHIAPSKPVVWRGGAIPMTVTANRIDDFDGPIAIRVENLPPGFTAPATFIEAGQQATTFAISAQPDATNPDMNHPPFRLRATANIGDQMVTREAIAEAPRVQEPGDLVTTTAQSVVTIRPGQEARLLVKIQRRNGFKGRVPLDVLGLPHGVRVLHVGLNGILITERDSEREIALYAEPWVQPMEHPFIVLARREGKDAEHGAPSVLLRVVK
jgi:dipeptidyl aminopeptidase/acylaminoacyl peptidase